jgi:phosphohistidine swiveling domain-containing protein
LIIAKKLGFNVPEFLIISSDFLTSLIPKEIDSEMKFIDGYIYKEEFLNHITNYFNENEFYAVRSSAINEDGVLNSFAGLYESKLFVNKNTLNDALKIVWKSAFSERVKTYEKHNNLKNHGIAIIVQKMVKPDVSGVTFAINPLTGDKEETVINAIWGLGEGLVSGDIDADLFVIKNKEITCQIADKKHIYKYNSIEKNGILKVSLDPENSLRKCLEDNQIIEIENVTKKLSNHFKHPQDVEFAYKNNILYILQSRPITRIGKKEENENIIWDNSNIIESYPDLTLPLTFSFIEKMYESVYSQLSLLLGISGKNIDKNKQVYENMLGLLCGRVYYNLNNWHKVLSFLPGYQYNKEFMDNMMGVKEKFDIKIDAKKNKWLEYFNVFKTVLNMIYRLNSIEKERVKFQSYFNELMVEYKAIEYQHLSLKELLIKYLNFENTLVNKWNVPLINDFFCMIYFGVLQKLVKKYNLDINETLHNDLIRGAKDIISTEPMELTSNIVNLIIKNTEITSIFNNFPPNKVIDILNNEKHSIIYNLIKNYIEKWGDRCVGELKLETVTYKQKPENYIKILQNLVKNKDFKLKRDEFNTRQKAEEIVNEKLKKSPLKKLIFRYILKKTRYLVSNRENLRFERTRAFGMVRIMMLEMGKKLANVNLIDNERDIFYLKQNEIFNCITKGKNCQKLKDYINEQKLEYENYKKINLPERIKTEETTIDFSIFHTNKQINEEIKELKGIACSSGIVKGRVTVIHSPDEIESLNNTILVTSSTDPGWVVLFPSALAIVVERGSLLSHSAIVSREMGIPCVVGVKNLLDFLKTGDLIEIDGSKGTVKILEKL